jgi:hypothetical protein
MGLDDYLVANSPMDLARLMERTQEYLPVVEVRNGRWGDAYDAVHEAMVLRNYLKSGPRVFVRSGVLVTTVRTQEDMPLAVQTLDETKLAGFLARNVVLRTYNAKGQARDTTKFPAEICRDLLNRRSYRGLPRLRGIVETPVLSADGHINVTPGYQEDTQLYYYPVPGFVVPTVPEHPNASEVNEARALLEEVLHEFPFDSQASKANALALLLLPFVREVIAGPTPLHLVDATTEGSGKTLLVNTVHRIATGRPAALGTWPAQEEEVRKRVTAALMRGSRWMIFDNVSGSLSSETLASILTSVSWSDRVLGSSQQVEVANLACWAATANNLTLSRELTDRTLWIRLEPGEENPRHRSGFLHDPLEDWLDKERGRLVWACLVVARVWWRKGKPSGGLLLDKTMGSFQRWFNVMGGVLAVAGIEGLLENREQQQEEVDADLGPWRHFYSLWASRTAMAEAPTKMLVDPATEAGLPLPERGVPEVSLGRLLKSKLGRVIGAYTLRRRMLNGVHLWRLEKK